MMGKGKNQMGLCNCNVSCSKKKLLTVTLAPELTFNTFKGKKKIASKIWLIFFLLIYGVSEEG